MAGYSCIVRRLCRGSISQTQFASQIISRSGVKFHRLRASFHDMRSVVVSYQVTVAVGPQLCQSGRLTQCFSHRLPF